MAKTRETVTDAILMMAGRRNVASKPLHDTNDLGAKMTWAPIDDIRASFAFPNFGSYRSAATLNNNSHSGPARRPAVAGQSASRDDERRVPHRIGFQVL
jgi:hypothetical protein